MGYNRDNYRRVREEYEHKYRRAREAADARRAEVELAIPEVAALDDRMRGVGLRIMKAAMEGGDYETRLAELRQENEALRRERAVALAAHGYPADYTEVKYECPLCGDTGYVDCVMCRCMKNRLAEAALESSGMIHLLRTQSFDNFSLEYYQNDPAALRRMEQILAIMRSYADGFEAGQSGNLVLFGGTGLGKTHLSSAVARVVIERGYDVYYNSAVGMLSDFEFQRFGNGVGEDSGQGTDRYFDSDLLIIDDLGSEIINQFTTSVLYNVINTRLNRRQSTIISTNLSMEKFQAQYWDRITSRVLGEYRALPFLGTDVRRLKLEGKKKA